MKIQVLQHSTLNTLGTIEEYARTKNHPLESTRFYKTKNPPAFDSFDLLIIMGSYGNLRLRRKPLAER